MKHLVVLLAVLLAGCSQPPQQDNAGACPPLPRPLGDTIAAQRAFVLTVVQLYATCASAQRESR